MTSYALWVATWQGPIAGKRPALGPRGRGPWEGGHPEAILKGGLCSISGGLSPTLTSVFTYSARQGPCLCSLTCVPEPRAAPGQGSTR